MSQLALDFDAGRGSESPAPAADRCILVQELAQIARETGRGRKILVVRTRGEGRELLRRLVLSGQSWAGFEVTTPRPLAMKHAADALAGAGTKVLDEFEERALVEEAIDRVTAGGAGSGFRAPFAGLAEKVGFRDAVRNSVDALRLAGISARAVRERAGGRSGRQVLLAALLEQVERMLDKRNHADTAKVLETAVRVVGEESGEGGEGGGDGDRGDFGSVPVFLVPGLTDRGLGGRFLRALERRGATVLRTDPVVGLGVPDAMFWHAGPAESAGSHLHAVREWRDRGGEGGGQGDALERSGPGRRASPSPLSIELFAAGSVHDELRGVLRRAIEMGARWDEVEIVASDPAMYGSALHALADSLDVPVTFAVGLPVERTRPGRVVAAYFRWIETGFQESVIRALVEAGDVAPPNPHERLAGPRLARALRRLRIGWGRERYMQRIAGRLRGLPQMKRGRYETEEGLERRRKHTEAGLRALQALLRPVLGATPDVNASVDRVRGAATGASSSAPRASSAAGVSPAQVAAGVKSLLARVTGGTDTDDTARDQLVRILDRIEATLDRRTDFASAAAIVKSALAIRVPAPRTEGTAPWSSAAGHLYLSDLRHGGTAGRPFTFVVGLDSTRFPGSMIEDPLLLDRERLRIGRGELSFAGDRAAEARFNLAHLVARLRGALVLSYARWDPAEARAQSPAPELLQALRLARSDPALAFDDLENHLGVTESRLPRAKLRSDLDASDVWLRSLATADGRLRDGVRAVGRAYPRLARGMEAAAALERDEASVHTGILGLRDPPLSYQGVRGVIMSPTGLQVLGACPRRFLFAAVLRVSPPNDPEFDPHRWLDALQRGSLLHDVYEHTLRHARDRGIEPAADAFLALAQERLDKRVTAMRREVPSPSAVVVDLETRALQEDVHSFVEMIRAEPPPWTELEMDFGMDGEGVEIPAGDGPPLRVRGRIDRVDDWGTHLAIVDYKTGGGFGHGGKAGTYRGGRKLQHAVYTAAAAALQDKPVDRMEYHFPSRRGENRRRRHSVEELRDGGALIATMLEGAAAGWFPATDDAGGDCRYCDYQDVCGVTVSEWGKASCRFSDWTARNLETMPELAQLRRARKWEE